MAATRRSMPWANVVVMAILFVVPLVWRHPIAGFGAVFFGWGLGLFLVARGGREGVEQGERLGDVAAVGLEGYGGDHAHGRVDHHPLP